MRKRAGETYTAKNEKRRIQTKPARQKLLPPAGSEAGLPERTGLEKGEQAPKMREAAAGAAAGRAAKCRGGKKGRFGQFA